LLALAVSTYVAAFHIESILTTGVICSVAGIAAGIAAIKCKRPVLAVAAFLTPILAVALFLLEALVLHLGPGKAATPFLHHLHH
jgi:hypothetical protein